MPRLIQNMLTARRVAAERRPGYYCDGLGLYLAISEKGKSWVFRYTFAGKRHDMGLGPVIDVSLAQARDRVRTLRSGIRNDGVDPLARRREERAALQPVRKIVTVEQCVRDFVRDQMQGKRPGTIKLFVHGIESRVIPALGKRDIATLTSDDVVEVFRPIWGGKGAAQTKQTLARFARVCAWAKANKLRSGDNPADWNELKLRLPVMNVETKNLPSLSWRKVGEFMAEVRRRDGILYRALEMVVLTGCRTDEVREMPWSEIDRSREIWSIPAARMKVGQPHVVPLTSFMIDVLDRMEAIRQNEWVFPGGHGPIHDKAVYRACKTVAAAVGIDPASVTAHGFRTTIYGWMREGTRINVEGYNDDLVNVTLAHKVDDKVQRAYDRADMLDKRREFLEHWGRVCGSATSGVVVPLKA